MLMDGSHFEIQYMKKVRILKGNSPKLQFNTMFFMLKRVVIPNSFDFRLETIGVFTNKILMQKAAEYYKCQIS